ncbi:MAG: alanine racemase [Acidobacteriia bacterium]|jgi:D-serine deaminase-like pyridoxal phosphate-dependent protein|nr:alanine racemase [Terriglobia bacterium]
MHIDELPTPVPLLDLDIMERNLERIVSLCREAGVAYRPHVKTHKTPELARAQVLAGATGITCAKVSEAEVMARAGLRDIFIAYPTAGRRRLERLERLARESTISVGVDSAQGAKDLNEYFQSRRRQISVLLEVDTGHHRCGVLPGNALEFVRFLGNLPALRFRGIYTHEGHVYADGELWERLDRARCAGETMAQLAGALRAAGLPCAVVSVGASPSQHAACAIPGVTENRPGTNALNDATQVHLGACGWEDCALSYLCTVVSRPAAERVIIDGGSKTFTSDHLSGWKEFGFLPEHPELRFVAASEEHGILKTTAGNGSNLQVGERIRVIPSHVCGSLNLHDRLYTVRGDRVVGEWRIAARGCVE